ncbi:hypothetical protein [Bacillus cereus]|uniref:hypothetical protein n=1 Tax=Bacillus cereus TaxID=1396 RepID=UPI0018794087
MKISIDHDALQWFKEELRIKRDESIRFTPLFASSKTSTSKFSKYKEVRQEINCS